jgi:transcriptional regulator with GAF, ATPase, and Fis domain
MVAYLAIRRGPEKGKQFLLDQTRPMHIGRGSNCEILLTDPISSRFHAVVFFEDGNWHVRDTSSRNGTSVNGQKTDHARLLDHSVVVIGDTELQLLHPDEPEADGSEQTGTIYVDQRKESADTELHLDPLANTRTDHLVDLYTLALAFLRENDPSTVIEIVLDLIRDRTGSDVVGISFVVDADSPRTQKCSPADRANDIKMTRPLIKRVIRNRESVWTRSEPSDDESLLSDNQWSEAIIVPLQFDEEVLGALHLYRSASSFSVDHFDLALASSRLIAIGIHRSHEQQSLQANHSRVSEKNAIGTELIGESPMMIKLKNKTIRVGAANGSVLIRGESGVGKELVARAVHQCSPRSRRPMLTVNCAAIPANLIESQLFGHKKGSFTGADRDHVGWFSQAHTGTLFLDEIGELPLEGQSKLLRILEGHPFLPVGGTDELLVDVRVIAATNRDLAEFVREGKFREDLFYRLSVFELVVPPLRDRGQDIERLVLHFFDHFKRVHARPGLSLTSEAKNVLCEYQWPGNVRQLRNVIDSAVVMADDPVVTAEDLGIRDAGLSRIETLSLEQWEKKLIKRALQRTEGSIPEAAKLLGISRATAYRKITEYQIDRDQSE